MAKNVQTKDGWTYDGVQVVDGTDFAVFHKGKGAGVEYEFVSIDAPWRIVHFNRSSRPAKVHTRDDGKMFVRRRNQRIFFSDFLRASEWTLGGLTTTHGETISFFAGYYIDVDELIVNNCEAVTIVHGYW